MSRTLFPPSPEGKSLKDFPEYTAAHARLLELEQQASAAQAALQEARDNPQALNARSENEAAAALVSGGTAVASATMADLTREVRICERAVTLKRQVLDEIETRLERDCTASERAQDDADAAQLVALIQSIVDLHEVHQGRRSSIRRRFGGKCSLPDLALPIELQRLIPVALAQFRDGAKHFGIQIEG